MKTYPIPLIPGPTRVPKSVLEAYLTDYGSGDLEPEYSDLYAETQSQLQHIFQTKNQFAIMTGEGMAGLWGAMKSCIVPGDKVLSVASGIFGYGFSEMAAGLGARVKTVGFEYDCIADSDTVEAAIKEFQPKMITAVHCETPSGTLNPIGEIGELVKKYQVPLFYVDAVASAGGTPLATDAWGIDLCLGGSQKCLSAAPDMALVSVSNRAWEIIEKIDYRGYDALKPWRSALANSWFPYTPSWHSTASLSIACGLIIAEGLAAAIARHERVAAYCRQRIESMGLSIFPRQESSSAPTVTVIQVPHGQDWDTLNTKFRKLGLAVGGAFGPLAGKVFRIGHMGSQAEMELVTEGLDVIEQSIAG
ncbi:MAG: alanine--glyoxylate aminotransferase family protein [Candidatus Latescibacteria bacterium]|nr:alanine--glyoxylate aminotransferase family protein [Candidatus Latescibacterota bacterium]